ncbi:hypothetical protein E2C01_089940 [Portunus trituberculatus]|uniref:Uncharacterized protein n=1 Tax=Portunus trituberculatus TaxID=210409 RepID=A0A5B7JKL7_PORTR|nr:hypothetical protein [Portunus trituberculatus]
MREAGENPSGVFTNLFSAPPYLPISPTRALASAPPIPHPDTIHNYPQFMVWDAGPPPYISPYMRLQSLIG